MFQILLTCDEDGCDTCEEILVPDGKAPSSLERPVLDMQMDFLRKGWTVSKDEDGKESWTCLVCNNPQEEEGE